MTINFPVRPPYHLLHLEAWQLNAAPPPCAFRKPFHGHKLTKTYVAQPNPPVTAGPFSNSVQCFPKLPLHNHAYPSCTQPPRGRIIPTRGGFAPPCSAPPHRPNPSPMDISDSIAGSTQATTRARVPLLKSILSYCLAAPKHRLPDPVPPEPGDPPGPVSAISLATTRLIPLMDSILSSPLPFSVMYASYVHVNNQQMFIGNTCLAYVPEGNSSPLRL